MANDAPRYNLLNDYGVKDVSHVTADPYWVLAVVRLGTLVSYDRASQTSFTTDPKLGVEPRKGAEHTLIIDQDCVSLNIARSKASHVKTLTATLKRAGTNYLVEIKPGDWLFAWIVNNSNDYNDLVKDIRAGEACNGEKRGLKFVGKVHTVYKNLSVNPEGFRNVDYQLQGMGFSELDAQIFYDYAIATNDALSKNVGAALARFGIDANAFFDEHGGQVRKDPLKDNVNRLISKIVDITIGRGLVSENANPAREQRLKQVTGGGQEGAGVAYAVPNAAAKMLDIFMSDGKIVSYGDILQLLQGVQEYTSSEDDLSNFEPNLGETTFYNRRTTKIPLSGSFYPFWPELTDKPLWNVLQQYLNPTVNEMYTCLRVSRGGIYPTLVVRQIPFTTDRFKPQVEGAPGQTGGTTNFGPPAQSEAIPFTRFKNLPRWVAPVQLVTTSSLGYSDSMRCNFVHVYGVASQYINNLSITTQMALNPPFHDDLDIQRSGLRTYMTTVDCAVDDQQGLEASKWMNLIADWRMGSHLTLNGAVTTIGVQAPVAEGDNLELDGVVYHIEGVTDACQIAMDGSKSWRTTFQLTNGVDVDDVDGAIDPPYPGITHRSAENIDANDPGITVSTRNKT